MIHMIHMIFDSQKHFGKIFEQPKRNPHSRSLSSPKNSPRSALFEPNYPIKHYNPCRSKMMNLHSAVKTFMGHGYGWIKYNKMMVWTGTVWDGIWVQDVKMEVSKQSDFLDRLAKLAIILDDHRHHRPAKYPQLGSFVRVLGHVYDHRMTIEWP